MAIPPSSQPTEHSDFDAAIAGQLGLSRGEAPATIDAAFAPVGGQTPEESLKAAQAYTRDLTTSHYENFSVVSSLLPKHLHQDFCNVYAFCRMADDLGDEVGDREQSLKFLNSFRRQLRLSFHGKAQTAVFIALQATVKRHDIPIQPFEDLITAFEQDQKISRYRSFEQVTDYCRKSADPVGRIVLYMCGYRDEPRQKLSDKICTALQLINFWQDVRRDILERDRIYLPAEDMIRFGVTEEQLRKGEVTQGYRELIKFEVERTEQLFAEGKALLPLLEPEYRRQISLFAKGGLAICAAVRKQKFDTLTRRPKLSKWQKAWLVFFTFLGILASEWKLGKKKRKVAP